jgi:hypothetical protein
MSHQSLKCKTFIRLIPKRGLLCKIVIQSCIMFVLTNLIHNICCHMLDRVMCCSVLGSQAVLEKYILFVQANLPCESENISIYNSMFQLVCSFEIGIIKLVVHLQLFM